jgi:addiction module HigA family antidote
MSLPNVIRSALFTLSGPHPGEILKDVLDEAGLTANALALALRVPANRIGAIVKGQRVITADTALRLARDFRTSDQMWMNLQGKYESAAAEDSLRDQIEREISIWPNCVVPIARTHTRSSPVLWRRCRVPALPGLPRGDPRPGRRRPCKRSPPYSVQTETHHIEQIFVLLLPQRPAAREDDGVRVPASEDSRWNFLLEVPAMRELGGQVNQAATSSLTPLMTYAFWMKRGLRVVRAKVR